MKTVAILCMLVVGTAASSFSDDRSTLVRIPYTGGGGATRAFGLPALNSTPLLKTIVEEEPKATVDFSRSGSRHRERFFPVVERAPVTINAIRVTVPTAAPSRHVSIVKVPAVTPLRVIETPPVTPLRIFEKPATRQLLKQEIPITKYDHVLSPKFGEYSLDFESANGIKTQESGFIKRTPVATRVVSADDGYNYGNSETRFEEIEADVQVRSGTTSWCTPEGISITLTYTADEKGYNPIITKGSCQATRDVPALEPIRFLAKESY